MPGLGNLGGGGLVANDSNGLAVIARLHVFVCRHVSGIELRELESLQQLPFVIEQQ
ncbi:hypothetical protein D3C84_1045440 [compost metagenome]